MICAPTLGNSAPDMQHADQGKEAAGGGEIGVDNAQDYRQYAGNAYLRYLFEDLSGPMPLPVSPYRSPYSN